MATATRNGRPPANGRMTQRVVTESKVYDSHVRRLIDSPSPAKMAGLLNQIDNGELGLLCQLQLEMERKSDDLAGVAQTRRNAVAGLEWCIDPDPNAEEDDAFAQEVAAYVGDRLSTIDAWPGVLWHLAEAIGPNLAVVENIWQTGEIVDFTIVPHTRLAAHPITNRGVVIRTDEEIMGIPTDAMPNKFIVFVPNAKGGFPFQTTLTHASIRAYLMAYFSTTDWLAFSELFGCPVRTATHDESALAADVETVKKEINEGGTDVAIVVPKGWELDFKQAAGTGETYERQMNHASAAFAKLWLGQTLTTDVGNSGSRALGDVHNEVRHDLRDADISARATCIRNQLIRPIVRFKWPNRPDAPVPVLTTIIPEARDVPSEDLTLRQLEFGAQQGLEVETKWLYESLKIPRPQGAKLPDTVQLKPKPAPAGGFGKGELNAAANA